jgi:hypothetical protein
MHRYLKHHFALLVLVQLAICHAQVSIVDIGATGNQVNLTDTYDQNFDSLLSSGGSPWLNGATLPGWYTTQSSYSANPLPFAGALGSYGVGSSSERALGSAGAIWALSFVNNSSQTISGFTMSYTGEQWYRGANDPQGSTQISFRYRVYGSGVSDSVQVYDLGGISNWTALTQLYITSPNQTDTTATALNGNAIENQTFVNFTLTGIAVAPNEEIWFRWTTGSVLSQPHAMAIDDLQVSFLSTIPEPASFASFAAAAVLGIALIYRRRRLPAADGS